MQSTTVVIYDLLFCVSVVVFSSHFYLTPVSSDVLLLFSIVTFRSLDKQDSVINPCVEVSCTFDDSYRYL